MAVANKYEYLRGLVLELKKQWPDNRIINIVCHGHSIPAGYFATPFVDTFNSYPFLLHKKLKELYPFAVINVIITAIGGENSKSGSKRFIRDVLSHSPDLITIDYGLNDRGMGLSEAKKNWIFMIEKSLEAKKKVILLTPSFDNTVRNMKLDDKDENNLILANRNQIIKLADEYNVGLADVYKSFEDYVKKNDLTDLLSWSNHPNSRGHELIANEIIRWFPADIT